MKKVTINTDQNIFDLALQEFGKAEAVFTLIEDNSIFNSLNVVTIPGKEISIDQSKILREDVVSYFENQELKIVTGEDKDELWVDEEVVTYFDEDGKPYILF